jgi:thymidylate synthase ThyX
VGCLKYSLCLYLQRTFEEYANKVFNPANAMVINRNDGMLNPDVIPSRDTMINLHTFVSLGRTFYTQEMRDMINKAKIIPVVY